MDYISKLPETSTASEYLKLASIHCMRESLYYRLKQIDDEYI